MRDKTSCANIVKPILYNTFHGNDNTRWGIKNKSNALLAFHRLFPQLPAPLHCDVFIVPFDGIYAANPDALVGAAAFIEIKCPLRPKELHNYTPEEAILSKTVNLLNFIVEFKLKATSILLSSTRSASYN